jgi:hypothetical protein
MKYGDSPPTNGGPAPRAGSPRSGGSIFTTSAPRLASIIVPNEALT